MGDKKKILVVDDEPDIVEGFTTFFEDNGYDTISASNGKEAFELAQSEKPDLITLDISMDQESGMKALGNLQKTESTANIPVIIITGVSNELRTFIKRSRQVEFPAAFIEKPVDNEQMLKTVRELIG